MLYCNVNCIVNVESDHFPFFPSIFPLYSISINNPSKLFSYFLRWLFKSSAARTGASPSEFDDQAQKWGHRSKVSWTRKKVTEILACLADTLAFQSAFKFIFRFDSVIGWLMVCFCFPVHRWSAVVFLNPEFIQIYLFIQ